ncbi:uncharacterized protein BJ171DRAFT_524671 [Polychytrium aggregatum]|uniref:uncharacterized protein n=1 Tax=Polychytrium aggregatum TaxID=110093 RepID=UPI0022FEFEE4|nr:uncharacterized protein BJ171DRAFT_524671 [Polychytrium aggregatum]KAI9193638.1 hypothetical protein BJ171DRAFT_524671 [Polychytrium aggregatum]
MLGGVRGDLVRWQLHQVHRLIGKFRLGPPRQPMASFFRSIAQLCPSNQPSPNTHFPRVDPNRQLLPMDSPRHPRPQIATLPWSSQRRSCQPHPANLLQHPRGLDCIRQLPQQLARSRVPDPCRCGPRRSSPDCLLPRTRAQSRRGRQTSHRSSEKGRRSEKSRSSQESRGRTKGQGSQEGRESRQSREVHKVFPLKLHGNRMQSKCVSQLNFDGRNTASLCHGNSGIGSLLPPNLGSNPTTVVVAAEPMNPSRMWPEPPSFQTELEISTGESVEVIVSCISKTTSHHHHAEPNSGRTSKLTHPCCGSRRLSSPHGEPCG